MTSELTAYCNLYYELTMLLAEREEYLKTLLDNAPLYQGQTRLSEIDAIMKYYRNAQAEKAKIDKTLDQLSKTRRAILAIMQHFEIPLDTVLTGVIPNEVEYQIWANEHDSLRIRKTKDLAPEEDNPNVIWIKFSGR